MVIPTRKICGISISVRSDLERSHPLPDPTLESAPKLLTQDMFDAELEEMGMTVNTSTSSTASPSKLSDSTSTDQQQIWRLAHERILKDIEVRRTHSRRKVMIRKRRIRSKRKSVVLPCKTTDFLFDLILLSPSENR